MSLYHSLSLCLFFFFSLSLCLSVYVSLSFCNCISLFSCISLSISVSLSFCISLPLSLCLTFYIPFSFVRVCVSLSLSVSFCVSLFMCLFLSYVYLSLFVSLPSLLPHPPTDLYLSKQTNHPWLSRSFYSCLITWIFTWIQFLYYKHPRWIYQLEILTNLSEKTKEKN